MCSYDNCRMRLCRALGLALHNSHYTIIESVVVGVVAAAAGGVAVAVAATLMVVMVVGMALLPALVLALRPALKKGGDGKHSALLSRLLSGSSSDSDSVLLLSSSVGVGAVKAGGVAVASIITPGTPVGSGCRKKTLRSNTTGVRYSKCNSDLDIR